MNPVVFIVGCQRSGTTLLRRMVDANPHIAIVHESRWVPGLFEERIGLTPEGYVTPDLIRLLLDNPRFALMEIEREDLEGLLAGDDPVPYPSFMTGVYDLYGKKHGKRLAGDKTPSYVRSIPTLHYLWPEAKFVHIIRDGRDVCLSATNWKSGGELRRRFVPLHDEPVTTTAIWWDWLVRSGREAGETLPPDLYREVRYESLVSSPERECEALCEFLNIPYDDAMVRFHEGKERPKPGRSAKNAWLRVTPGLRDWSTDMPADDIERFESAAGELLDELDYPRAAPDPGSQALATSTAVREAFARELLSGGDRPPAYWRA
ncbi:MAG TPA: sulfotransferase [Rubrobacteraceae bacterium]|nr:sulfotransferase [Rubrobacteraceae bacterium]